jgi:hypothetical protein
MERTRSLTMTPEEKKEARRKELAGRLRGLLQKKKSGAISLEMMKSELAKLEDPGLVRRILADELAADFAPDAADGKWMELAAEFFAPRLDSVHLAVDRCRKDMEETVRRETEAARMSWRQKGFEGPALIPNPDRNESWKKSIDEIVSRCRMEIKNILKKR